MAGGRRIAGTRPAGGRAAMGRRGPVAVSTAAARWVDTSATGVRPAARRRMAGASPARPAGHASQGRAWRRVGVWGSGGQRLPLGQGRVLFVSFLSPGRALPVSHFVSFLSPACAIAVSSMVGP